ncbi:MAG: HD domain-containing protein [Cellulosilyticaceae bacterium]
MLYRVKQFIWAITAKLTSEEKQFIVKYLGLEEQMLFGKLKVYEQKHSVVVARELAKLYEGSKRTQMIRVGLLHDVGKSVYPIGPIRKSIMVLLHRFTKGSVQSYDQFKMVKCYYGHPEDGYRLLREMRPYDDFFLALVRDHHKKEGSMTDEMQKLQVCDDQA